MQTTEVKFHVFYIADADTKGAVRFTLTAVIKPLTELDGPVPEQIWTAVKRIITICARARTAAVH